LSFVAAVWMLQLTGSTFNATRFIQPIQLKDISRGCSFHYYSV
jgi:hypothetical protein